MSRSRYDASRSGSAADQVDKTGSCARSLLTPKAWYVEPHSKAKRRVKSASHSRLSRSASPPTRRKTGQGRSQNTPSTLTNQYGNCYVRLERVPLLDREVCRRSPYTKVKIALRSSIKTYRGSPVEKGGPSERSLVRRRPAKRVRQTQPNALEGVGIRDATTSPGRVQAFGPQGRRRVQPGRVYRCEECGRILKTARSLHRHTKRRHQRLRVEKHPFECHICGKDFRLEDHRQSHMVAHIGLPAHVCSECDRVFWTVGALRNHVDTHSGRRPYICKVCRRGFARAASLKVHMKVHGGRRSYTCPLCDKSFLQKNGLLHHAEFHGVMIHPCDVCGNGFTSAQQLNC